MRRDPTAPPWWWKPWLYADADALPLLPSFAGRVRLRGWWRRRNRKDRR